jgi:WbqC-like protein family
MRIAIHQPNFMPWSGYFHKMGLVDRFVFFDHVQFPRAKSFASRVLIKTNQGPLWLTVPVKDKGACHRICDVEIDNASPWARKMVKTIEMTYRKAPGFEGLFADLSTVLLAGHSRISELNQALIGLFSAKAGIHCKVLRSSEMDLPTDLPGDEVIFQIVKQLGGDVYYSGRGAGTARYLTPEGCLARGIELRYMNFAETPYPQPFGVFVPKLSVLDLLMNCGADSLQWIMRTSTDGGAEEPEEEN